MFYKHLLNCMIGLVMEFHMGGTATNGAILSSFYDSIRSTEYIVNCEAPKIKMIVKWYVLKMLLDIL